MESDVRNLHRLVLKEIYNANAGVYRRTNVVIAGARHVPPVIRRLCCQCSVDWHTTKRWMPRMWTAIWRRSQTLSPHACARRLRSTGTH